MKLLLKLFLPILLIASLLISCSPADPFTEDAYFNDVYSHGVLLAPGGGIGDVTAAANLVTDMIVIGDGGLKGIKDTGVSIDGFDNLDTNGGDITGFDIWADNDVNITNDLDVTDDADIGGDLGVTGTTTSGVVTTTVLNAPTGRAATYTVAASDASAHVKAQADYLVVGDADDEIQNAIANLPGTGGTVQLTEGTFTLSTQLIPVQHTNLIGSGSGTIIQPIAAYPGEPLIWIENNDIEIAYIRFDTSSLTALAGRRVIEGRFASDTPTSNISIHHNQFLARIYSGNPYPDNQNDSTTNKAIEVGHSKNWDIHDNSCFNQGYEFVSASSATINQVTGREPSYINVHHNYINGGYGGIVFEGRAHHCNADNNIIYSRLGNGQGYGIYSIHADTKNNIISNNQINAQQHGIYLGEYSRFNTANNNQMNAQITSTGYNKIQGNSITNSTDGILYGNYDEIVGNTVTGVINSGASRFSYGTVTGVGAVIKNNTFINCKGAGIYLVTRPALIEGNTIISGGTTYAPLTINFPAGLPVVQIFNNTFLDPYSSINTTVSGNQAAGSYTLKVVSTAVILPGQKIETRPGGFANETHYVASVNHTDTTLTLKEALVNNHTNGNVVIGILSSIYNIRCYQDSSNLWIDRNYINPDPAVWRAIWLSGTNMRFTNNYHLSSIPSNMPSLTKDSIGRISGGEARFACGYLTAGVANAIGFAWNNTEFKDILIKKVVIEVTTGGGTAGSHLDVGIADSATGTNRGTEFFNDLLLNTVQVNDSWVAGDGGTQTKWVVCQDQPSAIDDWIVGQILDANASSLVGTYYIEYVGR